MTHADRIHIERRPTFAWGCRLLPRCAGADNKPVKRLRSSGRTFSSDSRMTLVWLSISCGAGNRKPEVNHKARGSNLLPAPPMITPSSVSVSRRRNSQSTESRQPLSLLTVAPLFMKTIRRKKSGPPRQRQANSRPPPLKLRRILVPLDFSGHSRQALKAAVPLARRYGGKITLVHVVPPPVALSPLPGGGQYLVPRDNDGAVSAAKAHLDGLATKLVPRELLERTLVREGSAYHEITSAARTLKIDLIVIATHGHSGLRRVLIGSTAERVVRHAHCPVLAAASLSPSTFPNIHCARWMSPRRWRETAAPNFCWCPWSSLLRSWPASRGPWRWRRMRRSPNTRASGCANWLKNARTTRCR